MRNHPLVDGNKRLGWAGGLVFLRVNGYTVEVSDDDAVDLVVGVAPGAIDFVELTKALRVALRPS